jgi:hypothetical protein
MARCEKLEWDSTPEVVQLEPRPSFFAEASQFVGLRPGASYEEFVANTRPCATLSILKARLAHVLLRHKQKAAPVAEGGSVCRSPARRR